MKNGDKPACPHIEPEQCAGVGIPQDVYHSGLTKREAFAMANMQGLLSGADKGTAQEFATYSVKLADALLAELKRTETDNQRRPG